MTILSKHTTSRNNASKVDAVTMDEKHCDLNLLDVGRNTGTTRNRCESKG
jgi:hypothetical protein